MSAAIPFPRENELKKAKYQLSSPLQSHPGQKCSQFLFIAISHTFSLFFLGCTPTDYPSHVLVFSLLFFFFPCTFCHLCMGTQIATTQYLSETTNPACLIHETCLKVVAAITSTKKQIFLIRPPTLISSTDFIRVPLFCANAIKEMLNDIGIKTHPWGSLQVVFFQVGIFCCSSYQF